MKNRISGSPYPDVRLLGFGGQNHVGQGHHGNCHAGTRKSHDCTCVDIAHSKLKQMIDDKEDADGP